MSGPASESSTQGPRRPRPYATWPAGRPAVPRRSPGSSVPCAATVRPPPAAPPARAGWGRARLQVGPLGRGWHLAPGLGADKGGCRTAARRSSSCRRACWRCASAAAASAFLRASSSAGMRRSRCGLFLEISVPSADEKQPRRRDRSCVHAIKEPDTMSRTATSIYASMFISIHRYQKAHLYAVLLQLICQKR